MKLNLLEVGQFFSIQDSTYRIEYCDNIQYRVRDILSNLQFLLPAGLEVDSLNEKDPADKYRLVRDDEVIEPGDEFYAEPINDWCKASDIYYGRSVSAYRSYFSISAVRRNIR